MTFKFGGLALLGCAHKHWSNLTFLRPALTAICLLSLSFAVPVSVSAQHASGIPAQAGEQSPFKLNATKTGGGNFSDFTDLGVQAYKDKDYGQAEQMFNSALEQAQKQKITDGRLAKMLTNLGSAYREQRRYKEAEQSYKKALDVALVTRSTDRKSLDYVVSQYKAMLVKADRWTDAKFLEEAAKNDFRKLNQTARLDRFAGDPFFHQAGIERREFIVQRVEWLGDHPRMDWRRPQYRSDFPVVSVTPPSWPVASERDFLPPVAIVPCPCHEPVGMAPPPMVPVYAGPPPWAGMGPPPGAWPPPPMHMPGMPGMYGPRMHGHRHGRPCR